MKRTAGLALSIAMLAVLAACSLGGPVPAASTTAPPATPTAVETAEAVTPTASAGPAGPLTLRIWVPPEFSPDPVSEGGALLKARLDEFVLLHPGVRVTVRIKAETGIGGVVRSLESMHDAVPDSLPDLILASRPEVERAAGIGLLADFPELGAGWYDFAAGLSDFDGRVIGLPFAADTLVLLYRPDPDIAQPTDWENTLQLGSPLLFAAGDRRGLFTFSQYLSAGGTFQDENGHPEINPFVMARVFQFYRMGNQEGIFPGWMAGLASQEEVFQNLQSGSARAGIVWVSDILPEADAAFRAAEIPGQGGQGVPIATGWLWALSNPSSPHQDLSLELARFLTEADFMGEWTLAAGYLPVRTEALAVWPARSETALARRLLMAANPLPGLDILETAGPLIGDALVDLWDGNATVMEAAERIWP